MLSTFTVNTDSDIKAPDSLLSLREAVAGVNSSNAPTNSVEFAMAPAGNTISLTQGTLQLFKNATIVGLGATNLTVQRSTAVGTPEFRVFYVGGSAFVEISDLTVANGSDVGGGAIYNDGRLLLSSSTLSSSTLSGNVSTGTYGLGGAIFNQGSLTVSNSIISGNSGGNGGGIWNQPQGTVFISNSTLSHNVITGGGGAGRRRCHPQFRRADRL